MTRTITSDVRAVRWTRIAALTIACATVSACGTGGDDGAPTRPTGVESMLADCTPFNDGLRCVARVTSTTAPARDVTTEATWSVSPPGVAVVPQPGLLVPTIAADVTLTVQYQSLRNGNPVEYRLAPGATPRPLTFLGVSALDESRAPLFRATVEIVAGTGAGQACLTNETGYCSMRGVLYGEPLRVRVSAEGYVPAERDHRIDPVPRHAVPDGVAGEGGAVGRVQCAEPVAYRQARRRGVASTRRRFGRWSGRAAGC